MYILKLKFHFILEYFNFKLSTCWSDEFGVKSKGFSKIRQIRLFRQGIAENLEYLAGRLTGHFEKPLISSSSKYIGSARTCACNFSIYCYALVHMYVHSYLTSAFVKTWECYKFPMSQYFYCNDNQHTCTCVHAILMYE